MRIGIIGEFFFVLAFSFMALRAGEVDVKRARKVAQNFYAEKGKLSSNQISFGEDYTILYKSIVVGYVFNLNNGFIIISAHDGVFPVLAYSFESDYMNNNFPPAFNFWMESYKSQISIAIKEGKEPSKSIMDAWERYDDKNSSSKEILTEVQPLIYTTWHQGCFYNSYFPEESTAPCGHLWTGCVATAMGQIMKYYNYPKNGTGSYGYNSSYGFVEADFGNTEYNWGAMDYHLSDEDSSVAQLLYHNAVSIHSLFFSNGTGAYDFDVRDALVDYFSYSEDAQFYWRDSYPGDWKAMLRNELDEGRPLLYGGADSQTSAGHTLVCDGYQDTSFFHFNWGWNGVYNGYFYLDSLIAGSNYFDFQHDAVVGIRPDIAGIIETTPPENISVTIDQHSVSLSWDPVVSGGLELLGYNIFRDGIIVNTEIISEPNYLDTNVPAGDHHYSLTSVYIGAESIHSAEVAVYISDIDEIFGSQFTIFPNPATDYLTIVSGLLSAGDFQISLHDLSGRKIRELKFSFSENNSLNIPLPAVAPGLYLIQIKTTDLVFTKKIVIH